MHYPDGSKSTDHGSANGGKPVNATVKVERKTANPDFHLNLYTGHSGGTIIIDNDSQGVTFKKNQSVDMLVDSWSTYKPGPIDQRVICYKKDPKTGQPIDSSYQVGGINGLSLTGDSNGKPKQWKHADTEHNSDKRKKCNRNDKSGCETGTYLYDYDVKDGVDGNRETTERTKGRITGKPTDYGDFVCTVYGLKTLSHKGNNGNLVSRFDAFVKNIKNDASGTLSNINALLNNTVDAKNPQNNSVRHIDWESVTFPIHVHPDAYYYNPVYDLSNVIAGNGVTSNSPTSVKPGSGTTDNIYIQKDAYDAVKEGALPPGTWYELKKYSKPDKSKTKYGKDSLEWAKWDPATNSNEPDNKNDPNNHIGKHHDTGDGAIYGKVTFRPDKWKDAATYYQPVVVHYPDGSTSEDAEAGNNQFSKTKDAKDTFNPVYAPVAVGREDKNNQLYLVLYKNYSPPTYERIPANGYDLKVGDSLPNDATFDSWMTKSVGKLHQHVICSKKGTDGKYGDYTYNTLPGHFDKKDKNAKKDEKDGLRFKSQKIWDHASFKQQEQCRASSGNCDKNNYLYDRDGASEQTRGYFGGKAQKTGDYQCKVYVISGDKKSTEFENAVKAKLKKDTSADPAAGLFNKKNDKYPYGEKGKGYETGSFEIRIHNDNHFYNPKYVDVSVTAGQKVENAVPQSVRSANGADKSQDAVKAGALPDGTWFEFKDAANGFEVNADGTAGNKVALDWSYWAGNAADSAGDQSNKPDNPSKQKKGKHSANGDGTRYGKVTFHPDQSVAPKAYLKEIVIHYPDGSTSDDSDSGNNGKPVYAKVTVGGLGQKSNLQLKLYKDKDPQTGEPMNGELNDRLYVMNDISLLRKPFIRTWSLTSKNKLNLRMLCHKDGTGGNWTSDENQSVVYIPGNGSKSTQWNFANEAQQRNCRERGNCNAAHTLYGFINDPNDVNSVHNALARTEDIVDGAPKQTGDYSCTVFTLDDAALKRFNDLAANNTFMSNPYNSGARDLMNNNSLKQGTNWDRLTFYITVVEKFALPKTGGEGMSMALLVVAMICMCVMCGAFFVDQTKWGHAMLAGAAAGMMCGLRSATRNSNSKISEIWRGLVKKVKDIRRFDDYSASAKDFVRKATGWLRAAFRRVRRWATERWRC